MKILGIVGGIGPESTIVYYRSIVERYRSTRQDGAHPRVIINSLDMKAMLDLIGAGRLEELSESLLAEVEKLARAGATFGLLAANTPHIVFDDLARRSPIPLISIVEAARDAAKALGLKKAGLFGTRFTMQGRFYPEVFSEEGIALVVPGEAEQAFIHEAYLSELVNGTFRSATRERMLAIARRMKAEVGIQGLVLGGTELPPLLPDDRYEGLPFLDTTRLHVERVVAVLLA